MGDHLLRQQDGWNVAAPTSSYSPLELTVELMGAKPFNPKILAEREGFYYLRYLQMPMNTTLTA
jgi:hypothetical protein